MALLIVVLIVLAALGILGAIVKGLIWLTLIAAIAFAVALVFGWSKLKTATR